MPAERFTKKARTAKSKRQWNHVHDSVLARGGSRKSAVIQANGVIKRGAARTRRKRR